MKKYEPLLEAYVLKARKKTSFFFLHVSVEFATLKCYIQRIYYC